MELFLALTLAMTAVPGPSGIELERLADSSVIPPGVVGDFLFEKVPPVVCQGVVLFEGSGDDLKSGAYLASSAGVEVIANTGTPVPGSNKTFQDARFQDCAGYRIVFLGDDDTSPLSSGRSVYTWKDGTIALLIKEGIHIGTSEVQSFNKLVGNEFGVAMVAAIVPASISQALVIKPFDGEPFIVADTTTVLPGQQQPATIFSYPVLVGRDLVFHARTQGNLGIYRWIEGRGISVIVESGTPVPLPGQGIFGIFGRIASLDYGIVFEAWYSGGRGIFKARDGRIDPLVVAGQVTEDGETLVASFFPSGAGSLLSFTGRTANPAGEAIYARTADGRIHTVLRAGDTIEGLLVDFINVGPGADHTHVAVWVRAFESGQRVHEVIYRATFPAPNVIPVLSRSGIAAMALALTLAGLWALRRSTAAH